jgi:hypothetical protein
MKSIKYTLLVTALCGGLSSIANAHFTDPTIQDVHSDSPAVTLAAAQEFFGNPNLHNCIDRINGPGDEGPFGNTIVSGGFTITFNADKSATISWSGLTDTFVGIYVKGGSQGGQFYGVSADEQTDSGSAQIVFAPNTGKKLDHPAGISHIDFFCAPGDHNVPDSGTTAMLLGCAITGLGVARRYLKR